MSARATVLLMCLLAVNNPAAGWQRLGMPLMPCAGPRSAWRSKDLVSTLRPPLVTVREAEHGFVDDDENLEPGEVLTKALKAFDADGTFLCAGALVRRRSAALETDVHDCWIADSMESGVGPNLQIRGAERILDELFLLHLHSGVSEFNVLVGDGEDTTAASRAAVLNRGFTHEVICADTDELLLRFCPEIGLERYRLVADGHEAEAKVGSSIVKRLQEIQQQDVRQERTDEGEVPKEKSQHRLAPLNTQRDPSSNRISMCMSCKLRRFWKDLCATDWQPLKTKGSPWQNPCFVSSFLTAISVLDATRRGLFLPFGVGPLLVLASSILYWHDPVKESTRRTIDIMTVRIGLACQVLFAVQYCTPMMIALPRLLAGYAVAMACYAWGRVLTVRGKVWAGAYTHCGVHVFANLGNLLILPFAAT